MWDRGRFWLLCPIYQLVISLKLPLFCFLEGGEAVKNLPVLSEPSKKCWFKLADYISWRFFSEAFHTFFYVAVLLFVLKWIIIFNYNNVCKSLLKTLWGTIVAVDRGAPASLTCSVSGLCVFQGHKQGNAQSLVRSWRGRYLLTSLEWWYGSLAEWGDKSFQNSFSKQKVARAACSEQLNETKGMTKAPVQHSMVGHPRCCKELCEELPACLPGTAYTLRTVAHYVCQFILK